MALAPLITQEPQAILDSLQELNLNDQERLADCIVTNNLGPLWNELLRHTKKSVQFSDGFLNRIKPSTRHAALNYLAQQQTLFKAAAIFDNEGIPFAVYKGAHIREILYDKPAIRPSADIDILISPFDKERAIRSLTQSGFSMHSLAQNISHEITMSAESASIDLHWQILQPGRLRKNMTSDFLAARQKVSYFWGLSNEATLFIMLVHPVFAKYSTGPVASLIQMVDLVRWTQTEKIDWNLLSVWLHECGVQTAAWVTTDYLQFLTEKTLPESFIKTIQPSRLKAAYLRKWIRLNLSNRFFNQRIIIHAGFTLPVHDTIKDAFRAIHSVIQERKMATDKIQAVQRMATS